MANRPKNPIMSYSEMVEANATRASSRLFSKNTDSGVKISALVNNTRKELAAMPDRISLGDTATVRAITEQYLMSCDEVGVLPSKVGLCRAFGCSRQAVTDYMSNNPRHSTTEFLQITFDAFNELLSNAALAGSVHPVYAIFLGKAVYGLRDNATVEIITPDKKYNDFYNMTAEEIAAKYAELPGD